MLTRDPWRPKVKVVDKAGRKFFLLRWRDVEGVPRQRSSQIPRGARGGRRDAERVAAELELELAKAAADDGLEAQVVAYQDYLESHGLTQKHVNIAVGRIRRAIKACGWSTTAELDADDLDRWFKDLRKPRVVKTPPEVLAKRKQRGHHNQQFRQDGEVLRGLSWRTINSYIESLKAWANWMAPKRIPVNPFAKLRKRNADTDRRLVRRALKAAELVALIATADASLEVVEGLSGSDRAALYVIAAWTGLRAAEIASLTDQSLDLAADPPFLTLGAGDSKHRQEDVLPLNAAVAEWLRQWLAKRPSADTLSIAGPSPLLQLRQTGPSGGMRRTAKMISADLVAAGIPTTDDRGRVVDFHALRHTFVTSLGRAGVRLVMAQALARHSTPNLTANVYNHLEADEKSEALNLLPAPPTARKEGRAG